MSEEINGYKDLGPWDEGTGSAVGVYRVAEKRPGRGIFRTGRVNQKLKKIQEDDA